MHLAQAGIKIHLHSQRTRLADGGGGGWVPAEGCSQRPSGDPRATQQNAHPLGPGDPARAGAIPNARYFFTLTTFNGYQDLTFAFSKD